MNNFKCLVVDDEPLARKGIVKLIGQLPFLELVDSCGDAMQAKRILEKSPVDLMFLDIEMPEISGLQFLKSLESPPAIVLTTAFPQYALQGFDLDVVDYLLKPISLERLSKAVKKSTDFILSRKNNLEDCFFIKCEQRYEKILFDEILFVQGLQNYVIIQTTKRKYITYLTLKAVNDYLPNGKFIKVNKSNILPIDKIDSISSNEISIQDYHFSVGQVYKEEILNLLLDKRLLIRK